MPAGATQVQFEVTTPPVTTQAIMNIMASTGGVGQLGSLSVNPSLQVSIKPLDFTPYQVVGGSPATRAVTLEAPAPAGGLALTLISRHPSYAAVPSERHVPAGATSATSLSRPSQCPRTWRRRSAWSRDPGATEQRGLLHIKPQLPTLTSLTMNSPVAGGSEATGTLTFSAPLPNIRWPAGGHGVRIRAERSRSPAESSRAANGSRPVSTTHTFRMFTRGLPTTQTFTVTAALDRTT